MGRVSKKKELKDDTPFRDNALLGIGKDGEVGEIDITDEAGIKRFSRGYFEKYTFEDLRAGGWSMGVCLSNANGKEAYIDRLADALWGVQFFSDEAVPLARPDLSKLTPEQELGVVEEVVRGKVNLGKRVTGVFEGDYTGGYLRTKGFARSMTDVVVVRKLVNEYALMNGDMIEGRVCFVQDAGFFCLSCIEKINGNPAVRAEMNRSEYRAMPARTEPVDALTLTPVAMGDEIVKSVDLCAPLIAGKTMLISQAGRFEAEDILTEMGNALERTGDFAEVFVLSFGDRAEITARIAEKFKNAVCPIHGETNAVLLRRVSDYAMRRAESGQKIAVILGDADSVGNDEEALRLASSAAAYENGGSLTPIILCDRNNAAGLYHRLRRLATSELAFDRDPLRHTLTVNMEDSYYDFPSGLDKARKAVIFRLADLGEAAGELISRAVKAKTLKNMLAVVEESQ